MARFLVFLSFFLFAVGACYAALPTEIYWKSVLPKTPMPSAIRNVIRSGVFVDGNWRAQIYKVSYGGEENLFFHAQSQIQDPSLTLFFLEEKLHPGAKMTFHFTRTTTGATLLARQAADSIPFSFAKLPEILSRLSIAPNSIQAENMKMVLLMCEVPAIDGETKHCATSIESMVDFSTSTLGTSNVQALSTTVDREATPKQVYTISNVQKLSVSKSVACHGVNYAYAVFYCHTTRATVPYKVSMVGEDGTKVEAVAACHTDTSAFNPEHMAFKLLDVKPGMVPICHLLPQNGIVWSPNKISASSLQMVV